MSAWDEGRVVGIEELREMTTEEYLDWLEETGQDVDQFDVADEDAEMLA